MQPRSSTNRNVKQWGIGVTLLGVLSYFFYFLYSGSYDDYVYDEVLGCIPAFIVLIGIPVTISVGSYLVFYESNTPMIIGVWVGIIFVIQAPIYGYYLGIHEKQLYKKYGVKTRGVVIQSWYSRGNRISYHFWVDGKFYVSSSTHTSNYYPSGDTVDILYNSKMPKMNMIVEQVGDE